MRFIGHRGPILDGIIIPAHGPTLARRTISDLPTRLSHNNSDAPPPDAASPPDGPSPQPTLRRRPMPLRHPIIGHRAIPPRSHRSAGAAPATAIVRAAVSVGSRPLGKGLCTARCSTDADCGSLGFCLAYSTGQFCAQAVQRLERLPVELRLFHRPGLLPGRSARLRSDDRGMPHHRRRGRRLPPICPRRWPHRHLFPVLSNPGRGNLPGGGRWLIAELHRLRPAQRNFHRVTRSTAPSAFPAMQSPTATVNPAWMPTAPTRPGPVSTVVSAICPIAAMVSVIPLRTGRLVRGSRLFLGLRRRVRALRHHYADRSLRVTTALAADDGRDLDAPGQRLAIADISVSQSSARTRRRPSSLFTYHPVGDEHPPRVAGDDVLDGLHCARALRGALVAPVRRAPAPTVSPPIVPAANMPARQSERQDRRWARFRACNPDGATTTDPKRMIVPCLRNRAEVSAASAIRRPISRIS